MGPEVGAGVAQFPSEPTLLAFMYSSTALDQSAAEAAMKTTTSWLRALSSEEHNPPLSDFVDIASLTQLAHDLLAALGRPAAPTGGGRRS